jgi:hypothetical protein
LMVCTRMSAAVRHPDVSGKVGMIRKNLLTPSA